MAAMMTTMMISMIAANCSVYFRSCFL